MTYSAGSTIVATDYNTLAWGGTANAYTTTPANAAVSYGVGTSRYGLGASVTGIPGVIATNTVTAAQWAGLIATVNNTRSYQTNGYTPISTVVAGNTISILSNLSTELTNAMTNAGTCALALTDSAPTNLVFSTAWGGAGNRRLTFTQSVSFASADAARYFFNAGGKIKISFSRAGGSATTRNTNWTALATAAGTIEIGYLNTTKAGGSGTPTALRNASNGGYWNMTLSDVTHFQQYAATAPYTIDYIVVNAKWSGTTANSGYPTLTFTVYWENDYVNAFQETVDGTATTSFVISSPPTAHANTYLGSATWGAVSLPTGTVTNN